MALVNRGIGRFGQEEVPRHFLVVAEGDVAAGDAPHCNKKLQCRRSSDPHRMPDEHFSSERPEVAQISGSE